jgi:hypothetical protein
MRAFFRLLMWGIVWTPVWLVVIIYRALKNKPTIDNCLSWALRQWQQEGGYLVIRWSRSAKFKVIRWPHFAWLPDHQHDVIQHYVPVHDDHMTHALPLPWFEGYVRQGDPPDDVNEN